jgi:hypothetical protein
MTTAEEFRHLAADLSARASREESLYTKAEGDHLAYLAYCYELLAEQAKGNEISNKADC